VTLFFNAREKFRCICQAQTELVFKEEYAVSVESLGVQMYLTMLHYVSKIRISLNFVSLLGEYTVKFLVENTDRNR